MNNLLYVIAIVLILIWAAGFFALHMGLIIHIILIMAIVTIYFGVLKVKEVR